VGGAAWACPSAAAVGAAGCSRAGPPLSQPRHPIMSLPTLPTLAPLLAPLTQPLMLTPSCWRHKDYTACPDRPTSAALPPHHPLSPQGLKHVSGRVMAHEHCPSAPRARMPPSAPLAPHRLPHPEGVGPGVQKVHPLVRRPHQQRDGRGVASRRHVRGLCGH